MPMLSDELFETIIHNTPLISIDLIIEDENKNILIGKRNNRPARGFWFVPGGRVLKDESLDDAFMRLTDIELGTQISRRDAGFIGIYEHFYNDNFYSDEFSTHYIVLAYKITLNKAELVLPEVQHNEYCWVSESELLNNGQVHFNTKAYFLNHKG
ncbi:GDP-mannose mannosyl hydrolase [Raoultella ornithinolytica]|uniref:GDP-mannose mannosyl hydrolase n=1 Tax=Raoultella ornithinolytica TaxID=54291 RepID=UPI00255AE464|nr:GDP-mannose mannosyl hydrolase [Raoultella ornithinolytica]MDL4583439.1 GDP-mannose mannosyl hydrolase [Raoultella ornithinolytica]HCH7883652.1 GDP-mannose mannosyl hydrolase [Raoultella ornithinolytica]HDH7797342.1 GDP-mannose mannosyl hydrolase [Raoultella ornithinolytica]